MTESEKNELIRAARRAWDTNGDAICAVKKAGEDMKINLYPYHIGEIISLAGKEEVAEGY